MKGRQELRLEKDSMHCNGGRVRCEFDVGCAGSRHIIQDDVARPHRRSESPDPSDKDAGAVTKMQDRM